MARKPNAIQPAWEFFQYCCIRAEAKIASGEEPEWFREHFDRGESIEQEYALPPRFPMTVALALDFSFEMTTEIPWSISGKGSRLSGLALRSCAPACWKFATFPIFL